MNNNNSILISIVIPTFNDCELLFEAIKSVISQSYKHWELIIVDNYSQDRTDEVINSFNNKKIKQYKINNNGVIGKSRNLGITKSSGEWIAFMDSDDIWYKNKLNICVSYIEDNSKKYDVISTNELMIFRNGKKHKKLFHGPMSKNMYSDLLIYGNRLSPSATMVRKGFLLKNKIKFCELPKFVLAEDYDFWLSIALKKGLFLFIDSIEGEYRIHDHNMSSQIHRHEEALLSVLSKHVFNLQTFEENKFKLWKKVRSRVYFSFAIKKIFAFEFFQGFKSLFSSLVLSPFGLLEIILKKMILKINFKKKL